MVLKRILFVLLTTSFLVGNAQVKIKNGFEVVNIVSWTQINTGISYNFKIDKSEISVGFQNNWNNTLIENGVFYFGLITSYKFQLYLKKTHSISVGASYLFNTDSRSINKVNPELNKEVNISTHLMAIPIYYQWNSAKKFKINVGVGPAYSINIANNKTYNIKSKNGFFSYFFQLGLGWSFDYNAK